MATVRIGRAPTKRPAAPAPAPRPAPPVGYVARTDEAPTIDGDATEAAWKGALTLRLDRTLRGGRNVAQPTTVKLLRDADRLYIAFICVEPLTDRLVAKRRARDGAVWEDDAVEVFLSPGDGYYHFVVNPAGSAYDARVKDAAFNSGFAAAAHTGRGRWTVEMAIPLKAMAGGQTAKEWRANFHRTRRATGGVQECAWSPTYSDDSHQPGRFGRLVFGQPPPEKVKPAPREPKRAGPMTVLPSRTGRGVVRFDLSILPRRAEVLRADLLVFRTAQVTGAAPAALVDIDIRPLFAPLGPSGEPRPSAGPLKLRGPWYDRFDATGAVRQWLAGKPNGGFFVKTMPHWNAQAACLDVAYRGEPVAAAPQQVTGVRAFHRAGQTFITWKEVESLAPGEDLTYGQYKRLLADAAEAVRYRIYCHDRPITAGNLERARRIAEVGPLSAWNINARNKEYLIGEALRKPDEMGELARNYNGEMHRWTMDSPRMDRYPLARFVIDEKAGPLPPATGLYVHHPAAEGRRYYAVVACRAGVENSTRITRANTTGPVAETVGYGAAVRQGKGLRGPYFDYPGTRWVYAQWCAPPLAPRPNMVFNWSVLIPPHAGDATTPVIPGMKARAKAPAELFFHAAGYSYAQPGKKVLWYSVQIAPHDWPASGWYGFNDAWGTLRSFREGKVANHTQKRIVAFLDWAVSVLPVDPDQVIAVGADGAAALAMNYPDRFAYVWITGFDRSGVTDPKAAGRFAAAWGPRSPEIRDDQGRADWSWAELDKLALTAAKDLPLTVCLGYSWGRDEGYARGNGRFYRAMQKARQPLMAYWGWNGLRSRGEVNPYTGLWRGHEITRAAPIPAFSNSSVNIDRESGGTAGGAFNWSELTDTPERLSAAIHSQEGAFDLTLRRTRRFRPAPGETVRWEAVAQPDPRSRSKEKPEPQSGRVEADANGLVTIPRLKYPARSPKMVVTITRAGARSETGQ
jgi:hypothetical protein